MVKYLLSTDSPVDAPFPELKVEDFAVRDAKNDYELPWILRGVMDDPDVKMLFDAEITELKENILSWNPTTRALRDMKKRVCAIVLVCETRVLTALVASTSLVAGTDGGPSGFTTTSAERAPAAVLFLLVSCLVRRTGRSTTRRTFVQSPK